MIKKRVLINDIEFDEISDLSIDNSISENNSISSFNCNINNFGGMNKDEFDVGNEIAVFANKDTEPMVKIFGGYLTSKEFKGEAVEEKISTEGKDYTSDLMDTTVVPEVYNNISCGSIVRDILAKYATDINTTPVGTAIRFDGNNDYVVIPGSSTDNLGSFTFAFWMKPDDFMKENAFLIRHGTRYFYQNGSGGLCAEVASEISAGRAITNDYAISGNTWHHIIMTYNDDDKTPHIYVNGSEATYSSVEVGSGTLTNYDHLFDKVLGTYDVSLIPTLKEFMYRGKIDEFKIYDKVISGTEIDDTMDYETSGTGRLAIWHFDEDGGKYAYDGVGTNNIVLSGLNSFAYWDTGTITKPTTYIQEGVDLTHVAFNHKPIDEALKYLAEKSGYIAYVDVHKNIYFKDRSAIDSGYTFYSGNIVAANFQTSEDEIKNDVWVYGDRTLTGWENRFTGTGTGSVFNTEYKPHNTQITVAGSLQKGYPLNMTINAPSGTNYLVGYDEKQIVFISGTSLGNSIPPNGAQIVVAYQRDVPIVRYLENPASKQNYGIKTHIELNKEITTPDMAYEVAKNIVDRFGMPLTQGNMVLQGVSDIRAGQTCIVDIPTEKINNETFDIINAKHEFTPENCYNEEVLNVKVSKRIKDVTDTLKQIILDLRKLQGADISESEVLTRYQFVTGSLGTKTNYNIYTRDYILAGSCGIYDHPVFGVYDNDFVYDGLTGSAFEDWVLVKSGGEF